MKTLWRRNNSFFLLALLAVACQNFANESSVITADGAIETRAVDSEGQDYYWYQGKKVYLTTDKNYVNVIIEDAVMKFPELNPLFDKANVESDNRKTFDGVVKLKFKSGKASASEYSKTVAALKQNGQIKYVLPYFERGIGAESIGTSDIFYLKLKHSDDTRLLEDMTTKFGVQIIEEIPYTPLWYTLSILGSEFNSSIEASNFFYETGKFEDVDPAFLFDFKPDAVVDEFWQQWGMDNIGQTGGIPGIDINVIPAWEISTGAGVKVAVVDTPIQSDHDDLNNNIHSLSYNARLKRTPSEPYSGGSLHGTHVTGIIAAEKNGTQVTGVAYDSKIVRVSQSSSNSNTFSSEMASGINWAWKSLADGGAGVDVINCSWGDQGGQFYGQLHSTILEQAIIDAMNKGRGNKGCVVVFTAGNFGHVTPVVMNYPGNFHPDILNVGSINDNGNRSAISAYGTALDVVAPGESIWSTIPYDTTDHESGTSMAAPHVAGIAALMLSVNPNLTRKQVADVITQTAQKVGGYNYTPAEANGLRNDQMGYGLVNAYEAVSAVAPGQPLSGGILYSSLQTSQSHAEAQVMRSAISPRGGNWTYSFQWQIRMYKPYWGMMDWIDIPYMIGESLTLDFFAMSKETHFRRKVTSGSSVAYSNTLTFSPQYNIDGGTISGVDIVQYGGQVDLSSATYGSPSSSRIFYWEQSSNGITWNPASGSATTYGFTTDRIYSRTFYRLRVMNPDGKYGYSYVHTVEVS